MNKISEDFESLLKLCDEEKDSFRLTIRDSFEKGFKLWFERYRMGDKSLDANLSGMLENRLSEEEAFYILVYTGGLSRWVNSELRNSETPKSQCKQTFVARLNQALDKMKSFNAGIVFRMDYPPGDKAIALKWFETKIGSKFRIPYFLSTAKEDYNNSEVVWQIKSLGDQSLGKDVSRLTNNKYELEVLFKTGSCFEILSVDIARSYIFLQELAQDSHTDFDLTKFYVGT